MQATITVQAKQSPAIGKKQGKIQDTNGDLWNVWGDKLQNYREGVTYDIVYETNEFNGHTFNVIKTANPSNQKPSTGALPQDGWPGPTPPPSVGGIRNGVYPPHIPQVANAKDEMIFVCGIVNNSMSNANINPFETTLTELIAMVDKARSAWRNTLGKSQKADDLADEIPEQFR